MIGISGRTKVVGVWGHPVGHSRSPAMHNAAFAALGWDWAYVPFDVDPAHVADAVNGIRALGLVGVNVTVPLKESVLPYLDIVDQEAARIGAVNTIHNVNGVLHGYSTDGAGFLRALTALGEPITERRAYLLGAGGSARAVAFALARMGNSMLIANRTAEKAQALAERINQHYPGAARAAEWGGETEPFDMLINATSMGMSPNEDSMPALPPGNIGSSIFVYDLVYAPSETKFLRAARLAGCRASNGLGMLVQQGALSLGIWADVSTETLPLAAMERAVESGF